MTFSLTVRIGDQWEHMASKEEASFRTTAAPECKNYPALRQFPYPVQKLIVGQYKEAVRTIENGDEPAGEMPNELMCPVGCLFYRQYQLPCKHLWHYNIEFDLFQESDWAQWAKMFEGGGFEIYETAAKVHVDNQHETIKGPDRHVLEVREILDHIKNKYNEIAEHTAGWTTEERDPIIARWITWSDKLINPIRNRGAEQVLKELEDEAEEDEAEGISLTRRKRQRVVDEDEGEK